MEVPFGTIHVTEKSKELIKKALDSNRISSGSYVREFEEKFSKLHGTKDAVAVSSGTDADAIALAALHDYGAKRGDEVIIPSFTYVSTAHAVLHAGFTPVFIDMDIKTLNIDVTKIEEKITKRTAAIMPVHIMGKPCDMDTIMNIANKHDIPIIEDAAEAHGAKYKGKIAGTMGKAGAFSLYVAHIITTGEGGIVITDDEEYADILRSLRTHGRGCNCKKCIITEGTPYCEKRFASGEDRRFLFERVGFSAKMNELEAAIGLGNIDIYAETVKKRHYNLLYLIKNFRKFRDFFFTIEEEEHEVIGPHAFPIILNKDVGFTREDYASFLEKRGIQTRTLFASIPTQYRGYKFMNFKLGDFPNAEYVGVNGIHTGVHQALEKEHLDFVVNTTAEFLESVKEK